VKKLSVPRRWLFLIAGGIWSAAGIILIERAYGWLSDFDATRLVFILCLATLLALVFYIAGFIKVVRKNIERINSLPENVCIFAFTAWKGYIIIAIMVFAGILLRNSTFPKHYLALFYVAMGGSLLMGGCLFLMKYYKTTTKGK
jgi:drug/metabolite transporter (DMT)-like permease